MIDVDLIKYLTREQAERMRGFEEMTATKGWKFLQEAFGAQFDAAKHAALAAVKHPCHINKALSIHFEINKEQPVYHP